MKTSLKFLIFPAVLALSALAFGETLAGTVTNGTTGKPAAGDDVVLIKLAQGMEEAGRTKTDAQGKFSFNLRTSGGPHLVRVIHQGVTYHHMAPPGTTSVERPGFRRGQESGRLERGCRSDVCTNRPGPARHQPAYSRWITTRNRPAPR